MAGEGLRYNQGKTRMDFLPPFATEQMAKVFTKGSEKYAPRNWEKGMPWTTVLASLKRHLLDWEKGEDVDPEDGQLLMAKVMTNAAFLTEYYKIYPQGDDRPHSYLSVPKIGLDIDDVLADFIPAFGAKFGLPEPSSWSWTYKMRECFNELFSNKAKLEEFYLSLPARTKPSDIPFEPHCYITSRSIPCEITEMWLESAGFPCAPVYTVSSGESKVDVAKNAGVEVFVDDKYENFVELNNAGICCYLFNSCHNQRYNVGEKRIKELKDLPWFK